MIGLLADRLQTVTGEFYNLEEIMLAGERPANKKAQ
jgi:hypothetical protein